MSSLSPYGIHWFRRDLRVTGNPALQWNWKQHKGQVVGLFCFDKAFLSRPDFSVNRFQFFLETLVALKAELNSLGGDLLVLDKGPLDTFPYLFNAIKQQGAALPSTVSWNRDYEPFARARDQKIETLLEENGVNAHTERDHLLIEPDELTKENSQNGFQVYTPFSRKWLDLFNTPTIQERIHRQKVALQQRNKKGGTSSLFSLSWEALIGSTITKQDALEKYRISNGKLVTIPIPKAGSQEALTALAAFKPKINSYTDKRDVPSESGTSRLSLFLKNGSLTISQIIAYLDLKGYGKQEATGRAKYLSELIWREFYYHILYRHPHVESQAFQTRYKNIQWESNEKWFAAWKEGRTGFPIVDAAMRELRMTGWMHNRARMIVASFLTKDLLIDWKWGEQWFMNQLLDGDLAPNNGGWQWAASTGCDPQPYFRIFNPWLQSKKFDSDGVYIKRFIPELRDCPVEKLHKPILDAPNGYPKPIVDHDAQRIKALAAYQL